jgi:hypothetical protein
MALSAMIARLALRVEVAPSFGVARAMKDMTSCSVPPLSAMGRAPAFRSPWAEQCGNPAACH